MVHPSQLTPVQRLLLAISLPITLVFFYFLFRRSDDEEDEEADARVATSRQTTIELKVPHDSIGAVIGVQGAQIKMIKSTTKARLNFKDKDTEFGKDRILIIQGTQEGAQKAELMVRQIIADQPEIVTVIVQVPNFSVGRIIGRNGETIRSISHQSKAKVNVERTELRDPNALVKVELKGTPIAVDVAKMLVLEKIEAEKMSQKKPSEKMKQTTSDSSRMQTKGDDTFVEVYVSAVEHPGHFWVQYLDRNALNLTKLVYDMTVFYGEFDRPWGENVEPVVGDLVAAPFSEDNSWYRARILGVAGDDVDVYFVDYGDSLLVSKQAIRKLSDEFKELPFQAKECCLAGIQPSSGKSWCEEAITVFEDLVYVAKWKVLMSRVISGTTSDLPQLQLIDTNGEKDIDVAEELVRRGLAIRLSENAAFSSRHSIVNQSPGYDFDLKLGGYQTKLTADEVHSCLAGTVRFSHDMDSMACGQDKLLQNSFDSNISLASMPSSVDQDNFSTDFSGLLSPIVGPYEGICDHLIGNSYYDGEDVECHQDFGPAVSCCRSSTPGLPAMPSPEEMVNSIESKHLEILSNGDILAHDIDDNDGTVTTKAWSEPLIIKQQTEFPSKVSEQEVVAINDGKLKSSEMSASLLMLDFPKTSEYIDEAVTAKLTSDCGPDLKEVQLQLLPLGKESEVLAKVISVSEMGRLITEATDDKPEVFIELDVQESRLGPENEVIGNDSMLPATDLAEPLSFDIPGAEQLCTHKTFAEEGSHASLSHLSESYPSLKRLIDDSKFRQGLKLHADDDSNVARTIRGQMQETLVKLANEYPTVKDCLSLANPHLELDGDIVEMRCCDKMVEISESSSEVNSSFQECDPPNRQDPSLLLEDSHVDGQSTSVVPDIVSKLCIGDPFVKLDSFNEAITEGEKPVASIEEHGFSCGTFGLDARAKLVNEARSIVIEPDKLSAADDLSVQSEAQCSKVESLKEVIGSIVDNPLQLFDSEEIQKEAVGAKKADYCETDEFPEDRRPEDTFQLHKWTRHEAGPVVSMTVMTENERTSNKREISPDVKEEYGIKCPRADHEYNQQLIESETSSGISKTEFQIEQESLVNPKCSEALQESGINFKKPVVVQESNCDTKESCFIESASIVDEKKMAKLTEKHTPESVNILCNLDDFDLGIYHFDSLCKLSELESGKLKMPLPVACRPEWSTNDYDSLVTYIVGNEQKKERSKDSCAKLIDRHKKHDRAVERRLRAMEESSVKMTKSETLPPNLASRALRSGLLDLDLDDDTYQDGDCDDEGFTVVESRRRRRLRSRCLSEREHSAEIDETHSVLDHDKSQLEQNNCGTADLRPVEIKTVVEFLPPESGQMLQMEVFSENCTLLEVQDLQLNSDHYAALCRLSDFETGKLQLPRKLQCHLSVSYTENSSNDDRKQQMQHYDQVKPCELFRTNDHADVDRCPTGLVAEAPETRSVGLAPSLAVRAFRSGLLDINLDQHFVDEGVYQDEEDVGCTLAEPRRHRRQNQRLLEIENQGISMIKNQEMVSSPARADALLVKSSEWEENLITGPLLSKYTTEFKEEKLTDVVDRQDCEANTGKMNTEVEQTRDVELERVFDDRNEPISALENLENSVQIQTTDVSDVEQEQAVYLKQQPWLEQITQVENELLREKETDVELDASQLKAKQPSITLPVDQEQVEKQIRTFDLTLATGELDEDLIRNKYQILHASEPCLRVNIPEPATNDLQSESQDKGICQIDYTDSVFVQTELYVKEVESGESRPEDGLSNVEADDKQPIEADGKQPIEADDKQPIEADDKQPIEADDKQEPIVSVSVEKLPLVANELVIDTLSYFYPSLFIFNDFENKLLQEEPDREHECFELADINNIGCTQKISDFKTVDQNDKILELREVPPVGENLTEGAVIQVFTKAAEGGHEMIDKPFFTHKKRTEFDVLNDEHHKIKIEEAETRTRKDQEEDAGTEIIFGPKALEKTEAKGISTEADVCTGVVNKEYAEEVNELSVMKSVENETALCDQDLTLVPEKPGLGVGFISECLFEKIPVQESISLTGNEDQQIIIHSLDDDYRSDTEILNHHFPALCTMAEYESGMMQSKPCIQGFPAQHVNEINALVTCIEGEDKVKNLGNSHSKADTHEHSKAHRRSKSPEQATKQLVHVDQPPDLASRSYRAGLLDVEAGHGEETIEVDLSGGNGDDFQLVESRKHRRRRNKKSERKQHLDELNLSPVDREQCGSLSSSSSEIIEQVKVSSVTSLHKEMKVMTIEEHEALNMLDFFQPELNIIKDYFPALCCLAEFESGFISIGSELSKHCQEWETSNIETLVSYVQGDSKKSRMDRKAHSEAHDRSKPHIQSKADERKALQAGLFDVTAGFDKELVAVHVMDDGDDGYTFVESKRHRRQHAKHSEEKAAAVEADDPSLRKDVTECCGSEEFDRVSSTDYDPDFYRQEFSNDLEQLKDDEGIYTGGLACDEFEINRIALQPDEAFLIFSQSGSESSPATTESEQSVHDEKISACAELLTRPATLFPLPENNVLLKGEEHIEINSGTNMEEIIVDATFRQMNVDPLDPGIDPDETDMKWKEIRTDLRPLKTGVEELSAPLMTSENLTAQEHILDGVADEEFKAMKASLSEAEFEQHMRAFYQHNYAQHGTDECTDYDLELEIDSNEKIGMNYSVEFGNSIVSHDEFMLIEKPELENALDKSSDLVCQVNSDFEDDFGPSKEQELLSDVANSYDETYFRISGTESSSCSPQKIAIGVSEIEHGVDHKADNDDDDDDDFEIINVLTSSKAVVKGSKTATIKIDDECASSSLCTDFKFEMVEELNKWNVAPYQLNHSTERVFEHISKPLKKIVIYADDVTLNSQSKSRNFEPNAKNLFARDDSGTEKAASVEGLSPSPAERFMDELRPGTNELFHDFKPITKERIYGDVNSKDVQFAAGGDVHLDTKYKEVLSESESFDTMIHSTAKEERNKVEQFSISTASQYEPEIEEVAFDTFTKVFEILKSIDTSREPETLRTATFTPQKEPKYDVPIFVDFSESSYLNAKETEKPYGIAVSGTESAGVIETGLFQLRKLAPADENIFLTQSAVDKSFLDLPFAEQHASIVESEMEPSINAESEVKIPALSGRHLQYLDSEAISAEAVLDTFQAPASWDLAMSEEFAEEPGQELGNSFEQLNVLATSQSSDSKAKQLSDALLASKNTDSYPPEDIQSLNVGKSKKKRKKQNKAKLPVDARLNLGDKTVEAVNEKLSQDEGSYSPLRSRQIVNDEEINKRVSEKTSVCDEIMTGPQKTLENSLMGAKGKNVQDFKDNTFVDDKENIPQLGFPSATKSRKKRNKKASCSLQTTETESVYKVQDSFATCNSILGAEEEDESATVDRQCGNIQRFTAVPQEAEFNLVPMLAGSIPELPKNKPRKKKNKSGKAVETSSFVLTDQQIEQNFIEDGVHYIEHQPSFSNVETGEAYMGADNVFPERHEYGNVQSGEEARVGRESHAVVRGGKKSRKTNNKIAQDLENEFAFSPPRSRHLPCERETRASLESEVFSECDDMERTPAGKNELHQTCGYTGNQSPEDKEKPSKQLYETDLPLAQPESCDIDEILSDDDDEEEDQGPVVPSGSTIGDMQMVGGATVIALRSSAENKRLRRRRKRTRRRLRDRGLLPSEDLLTPGSADSGKLLSGASVGSDRAFRETTRTSTAVRRRRRQRKAKYSETKSAVVESQRVNVLSENPVQTEAGTDFFGDKSIVTEQKPVLTKHLTKKGRSKEKKTKPLGSAAVVKASVSSSLLEPNDDATAPTLTDEHDQAKCCAEKCEQEKTGEIVTGQLKQGKTFVPEVLPDKSGHGQQSMSDVAYQISMTQTDQELRAAEKSSQQKQGKDKSLETDAEHLGTGKCFERHLQERNARKSLAGKGSEIDDKRLEWQTPEHEPRNLPEKPPQDPDSKLCSKEQPHHLEMKSLTQTQHQKCKREQNLEHGNTKRMPGEGNSPDEAGTKRFGKKNNEDISKDDKTALKTAELSMDTALSSFELVPGTIKTSDSDSDRVHTSMNQERTVEERSAEIGSNAATQKKKKKQRKTCVTELNSDSIRDASMAEFHCGEINVNQESLKPETEESSTIAEIDSVAAEKKKKKKKKKSGSGIQRPVLEAETGLSPNFVGNEFVGVNKETSEMGYLKRHEEFMSGQQKTECFDKLVNIPIHPLPVPVDGGRTSLKKKKEKKAKSTSEDLEINKKISEENGECDVIMAENGERRLSNEQFFTSFSTISSHDLAESKPTETDCTKDSVDVLLPSPFSSARDEDQHMANDYAKTQKSEASKSPKAVSLDLKTDWVETKAMARPITESRCISEACHQDTVSIDQSVSSVINLDRQDRWSGQANLLSESSSCDRSARSIVENQDCLLEAMLPELDLEIIARDDESLDVEQSDVTKLGTSESSVPPMQMTPKDLQTEDVQSQVSCQSVAVVAVTEVLDLEFMEETEMVTVVEKVVDSGKISQAWSDGQPKMSPCSSSATANTSADSEGREVPTGISGDELAGLQGDTLGQNLRKGTSDMSSVGCVPECGDACADGALKKHPFTVSSMFSDIPQFGTGHSYPTGASLPISPTNSPSRSDGYKQLLDLSVSELDLVRTNCEDNGLERSHFLTSGAGSVSTSTWPSVMYSFERPATGDSAVSLQGSCCVHTWSSDDVIGRVHDLLKTFETNPESYNDSLDEDLTLKVAEFQSDDVGSVTEIGVADPGDEVKHPVLHGDKWDSLSNDSLEVSSTVGVASQRESSLENVSEDSLMGNLETRQQMHRSQQNVSGGTMDIGIRGGSSNLPPATQEERTKRKRKLVRKMPPPRAESDDDNDTNNRL